MFRGERHGYAWYGAAMLSLLLASASHAGIHTWDVREVFSNADGTVQFIELLDLGTGGTETGIGNSSASSSATGESFSWANGPLTPPTNGRSYLIATAGFAALPGAPVPDVLIPAVNVPFFDPAGDTVCAGPDCFTFASAPTDGIDSLDEVAGVGVNTPTNYAGDSGTVDASGAPSAPVWPALGGAIAAAGLGGAGARRLRRGRSLRDDQA